MKGIFLIAAGALLLGGCATESASDLGERYWRTKDEADRVAWIEALDREGHDFSKRYRPDYGERGIYKFNREVRLASFVITKSIAERLGKDSVDLETTDGPVHFEWSRKDDGSVDYRYAAPTNWEVFVRAYGNKGPRNPIEAANIQFRTSFPREGAVSLQVMHHREAWKAGPYADVPFPTNEIAAANNFIFALREAFLRLGFCHDGALRDGYIWLAGFDSNFPNGHTDFPAHFHFGVNCRDGNQTHHFYMDPATGRITWNCFQDMSKVIDVWDRAVEFHPGDEFPAFDGRGHVAFRVRMLADGVGLEVMSPDRTRRIRLVSPSPKDYVDVQVPCGGAWHCEKRITVYDDPEAGILRTPLGEVRYDPATGRRMEKK